MWTCRVGRWLRGRFDGFSVWQRGSFLPIQSSPFSQAVGSLKSPAPGWPMVAALAEFSFQSKESMPLTALETRKLLEAAPPVPFGAPGDMLGALWGSSPGSYERLRSFSRKVCCTAIWHSLGLTGHRCALQILTEVGFFSGRNCPFPVGIEVAGDSETLLSRRDKRCVRFSEKAEGLPASNPTNLVFKTKTWKLCLLSPMRGSCW